MDLKVGDLVAFKKYEDMTEEEQAGISEKYFPEFGKISAVYKNANGMDCFEVDGEQYMFSKGSVDYIIVKGATDDIHVGDEVLVKTTVGEVKENYIWVSWISKDDVVKVLKRKEEHFIVQEDHYGMYVNGSEVLVVNKDDAKIFDSRNEANKVAAEMHLNTWDVIPYDA